MAGFGCSFSIRFRRTFKGPPPVCHLLFHSVSQPVSILETVGRILRHARQNALIQVGGGTSAFSREGRATSEFR
jgi:hypothetical protein